MKEDYIARSFQKIDDDLAFLMNCFRTCHRADVARQLRYAGNLQEAWLRHELR